jgi:hypothetical protein
MNSGLPMTGFSSASRRALASGFEAMALRSSRRSGGEGRFGVGFEEDGQSGGGDFGGVFVGEELEGAEKHLRAQFRRRQFDPYYLRSRGNRCLND